MSWLGALMCHIRHFRRPFLLFVGMGMILVPIACEAQWEQTSRLPRGHAASIAVSGTHIFVGTMDAGVFRSTDNGASWEDVNLGLPENTSVFCLAVSDRSILAGTDHHGVFLSIDGGANWSPANSGLPSDVSVSVLTVAGTDVYAGTWGHGVFLSSDGGMNWKTVGSESALTHPRRLAVIENGLIALSGPELGDVFLFRDDGGGWRQIDEGVTRILAERHPGTVMLAEPFVVDLAVIDTNLLAIAYGGGAASMRPGAVEPERTYTLGGVFSSADGGANWDRSRPGDRVEDQSDLPSCQQCQCLRWDRGARGVCFDRWRS